jgi:choline-glycine betaine transporter
MDYFCGARACYSLLFYRHNLPMRISSLFYPILEERAFSPGAGQ